MQITGGFLKSRKIESPKGENVRPTLSQVRESIFSALFSVMDFEGKSFLDTFAGSGIMGFEAFSRGFEKVSFIEKDKKTFFLLKDNSKKLGIEPEFYLGDTKKVLRKIEEKYDVIYIDPPYQGGLYEGVLTAIAENNLLKKDGIVILEHPKNLIIDAKIFDVLKQKVYADKCVTFLSFAKNYY